MYCLPRMVVAIVELVVVLQIAFVVDAWRPLSALVGPSAANPAPYFFVAMQSGASLSSCHAACSAAVVGGYVAVVTSASEQALFYETISKTSFSQLVMGATRGSSRTYRWVEGPLGRANGGSGTAFWVTNVFKTGGSSANGMYSNWASGQPDNSWLVEDHLSVFASGGWNDVQDGGGDCDGCACRFDPGSRTLSTTFNLPSRSATLSMPLASRSGSGSLVFTITSSPTRTIARSRSASVAPATMSFSASMQPSPSVSISSSRGTVSLTRTAPSRTHSPRTLSQSNSNTTEPSGTFDSETATISPSNSLRTVRWRKTLSLTTGSYSATISRSHSRSRDSVTMSTSAGTCDVNHICGMNDEADVDGVNASVVMIANRNVTVLNLRPDTSLSDGFLTSTDVPFESLDSAAVALRLRLACFAGMWVATDNNSLLPLSNVTIAPSASMYATVGNAKIIVNTSHVALTTLAASVQLERLNGSLLLSRILAQSQEPGFENGATAVRQNAAVLASLPEVASSGWVTSSNPFQRQRVILTLGVVAAPLCTVHVRADVSLRIVIPVTPKSLPTSFTAAGVASVTSEWISSFGAVSTSTAIARVAAARKILLCSSGGSSSGGLFGLAVPSSSASGLSAGSSDADGNGFSVDDVSYARGAIVGNTMLVVACGAVIVMGGRVFASTGASPSARTLTRGLIRVGFPSSLLTVWTAAAPTLAAGVAILSVVAARQLPEQTPRGQNWWATMDAVLILPFGYIVAVTPLVLLGLLPVMAEKHWQLFQVPLTSGASSFHSRTGGSLPRWLVWTRRLTSLAVFKRLLQTVERRFLWRCRVSSSVREDRTPSATEQSATAEDCPARVAQSVLLDTQWLWFPFIDVSIVVLSSVLGALSGLFSDVECRGLAAGVLALYASELLICAVMLPLATLFGNVFNLLTLALNTTSLAFQIYYVYATTGAPYANPPLWALTASTTCDLLVLGMSLVKILVLDAPAIVKSVLRFIKQLRKQWVLRHSWRASANVTVTVYGSDDDSDKSCGDGGAIDVDFGLHHLPSTADVEVEMLQEGEKEGTEDEHQQQGLWGVVATPPHAAPTPPLFVLEGTSHVVPRRRARGMTMVMEFLNSAADQDSTDSVDGLFLFDVETPTLCKVPIAKKSDGGGDVDSDPSL